MNAALGGAMPQADTQWYVIQTKRHRERVAASMLGRHFETYLPMILEQPPPVVGSSVAPLFPCYIFVRAALPHAYYPIARSPGVKDFVRDGDQPGAIDDEMIDLLRRREGPDGVVRCAPRLESGDEVEIVRGALNGFDAVVEEYLPSRERVRLLLSLFQRESRVEVPSSWIRER